MLGCEDNIEGYLKKGFVVSDEMRVLYTQFQ